jgi:hypothetical protein
MKDRLDFPEQPSGQSYFCQSYKQFFEYAMPRFMQIAASLIAGLAKKNHPFI